MRLNSFCPSLTELGDRIVPSVTVSKPVSLAPAIVAPPVTTVPAHPLIGTGTGSYHIAQTPISGLGQRRDFFGKMSLGSLGTFDVTGSVRGNADAGGRATGTLTLTNAQGSITISLRGPIQSPNAAVPSEFVYTVTKATGAYQNLHGGYGLMQVNYGVAVRQPAGAVVGSYQFKLT